MATGELILKYFASFRFSVAMEPSPLSSRYESHLCSKMLVGWLVVLKFSGPLRHCFSLYRVVSQTERIEK